MRQRATRTSLAALTLLLGLLFGTADPARAQTIIEPGPPGTINQAILGDTTATGERVNCHYVLRRDAFYIYNQKMDLRGDCTWIIEAEPGSGERPVIRPAALPGGDEAPRPFQLYSPTTYIFRDLWIDGYDTSEPEPGRPGDNATIRASSDGARIFVDGVRFDRNRQMTLRSDNDSTSWYITNSEFSNIYNVNRLDQSYILHTRGNVIDTVSFVNNSVWNHTGQVVTGADDGKVIYLRMDHNTFVNVGGIPNGSGRLDTLRTELPGEQDFGVFNFARTEYLVFRNNLLVNPGFVGTETNPVFTPRYVVDLDSLVVEDDVGAITEVAPRGVDIRNNVVYIDPAMEAAYPDTIRAYSEDDIYDPTLDLFIDAKGSASTLLTADVSLTDAPRLPTEMVSTVYEIWNNLRDNQALVLPRDTRNFQEPEGVLDFSYSQSSAAYTAGVNGAPVGDLNWFGMADGYSPVEDEFATVSTSSDRLAEMPEAFRLRGNYPNPFNPVTSIQFDLQQAAHVSVAVFDVLGRRVMTVPAQAMQPGAAQVIRIDAGQLTSGLYVYQVRAETPGDTFVQTGRMVLVK